MKKVITKVRSPNNFLFEIKEMGYGGNTKSLVYVYLKDKKKKNKKVGEVRLYHQGDDLYETHSNLDEPYHGRGLGAKLYARAIQWCLENGFRVRSTGSSSELAQRVWRGKTIRKYFRIRTKRFIYNAKHIPSSDTWYAYPKLQ